MSTTMLRATKPIEEAAFPECTHRDYFDIHPGLLLNDRYQIVSKLGYGRHSTVWMAKDIQIDPIDPDALNDEYVTVKVGCARNDVGAGRVHEWIIDGHLHADVDHEGSPCVRTMLDSFMLNSPGKRYPCSVFTPSRETWDKYQQNFDGGRMPLPLLKTHIRFLCLGLDDLHSRCRVIHTDLKESNIKMIIEDKSVLDKYIEDHEGRPAAHEVIDGQIIYKSQDEFGELQSFQTFPQFIDFGSAVHIYKPKQIMRSPIQPPVYRAPEVLLGTGWSFPAEVWNFGLLVYRLMEQRDLFERIRSASSNLDTATHLGAIIGLLGPPPKNFAKKAAVVDIRKWPAPHMNHKGDICSNYHEYFGGPFFTESGIFKHEDLIARDFDLSSMVSSIDGAEKELLLDFLSCTLRWLPKNRMSARELLSIGGFASMRM